MQITNNIDNFELDSKGRDKLENEKNKQFDYSMFHHRIDTIYDSFERFSRIEGIVYVSLKAWFNYTLTFYMV